MKYEDIVDGLGQTEVITKLLPQVHTTKWVGREDWSSYMAEPIRELWRLVCYEKDAWLLQKATYADWEDFCWRLTLPRTQDKYSERLQRLDGLAGESE